MSTESTKKTKVIDKPMSEEAEGRKDLVRVLILCVLAVVIVRSFIFEPFKIPSGSMLPTLQIGDHIFVSKFNYGLSIPFTKIQFLKWGSPSRGDVVVFLNPRDESLHYVKRVVGIPGDKIKFVGKKLYINGELVNHVRVTDPEAIKEAVGEDQTFEGELYRETLSGTDHFVQYSKNVDQLEELELERIQVEKEVPPDSFFVVGDNRDHSYDSRSWGFLPAENIKGKAQIIWLSLNQDADWGSFGKIRWGRCGVLVN